MESSMESSMLTLLAASVIFSTCCDRENFQLLLDKFHLIVCQRHSPILRPLSPSEILQFVHMPKTGDLTLFTEQNLSPGDVFELTRAVQPTVPRP